MISKIPPLDDVNNESAYEMWSGPGKTLLGILTYDLLLCMVINLKIVSAFTWISLCERVDNLGCEC